MKGYVALTGTLSLLLIVSLLSRSTSSQRLFSARTSRRVVQRMIEACQRALERNDRSPTQNVAQAAVARPWAEAALAVASEETIRTVTGVDCTHLIDRAQRKLDAGVRAVNRHAPRVRVHPDELLASP